MTERKNVAHESVSPTIFSLGSTEKKRVSRIGMSSRSVARPTRTFATNNSPATAACARTGSGRDHTELRKLLKLRLIRIYEWAGAALVQGVSTSLERNC